MMTWPRQQPGRSIGDEELLGILRNAEEAPWPFAKLQGALRAPNGKAVYQTYESLRKRIERIETEIWRTEALAHFSTLMEQWQR